MEQDQGIVPASIPENTGTIRNERGQFVPGVSGNPKGKPAGSVSIVAEIKKKLEEVPAGSKETYLKIFVFRLFQKAIIDGDTTLMKDMIDRVDGRAKQNIGLDINDGEEERTELKALIEKLNGTETDSKDSSS